MKKLTLKVKEGDEVCFMNQSVCVEIDVVDRVYKPAKSTKPVIQLKYSGLAVKLENQDILFPKAKAARLHAVIQKLKMSTETDYDKIKALMLQMMVEQENMPIYLPAPNRPMLGFE